MKLKTILAVVGLTCGLAAEDWPGGGVFTAATIDDFGSADVPFTLGTGLLKYTGPTATLEKGMTLSPETGLPATIRVTEPGTTLTISGNVNQTTGAFIKDGPGTLKFAGPANVIGKNRASESADSHILTWDETTGLCGDKGYAVFTVNEGRVIMGGPGVTNKTTGIGWVGSRTQKSTRLDIIGGRHEHLNNWFCISRGAGMTNNDVTASMYVSGGASVALSQLCMNNGNGQAGYYGRSLLDIDNSTVSVANDAFIGEGTGEQTLRIGPGSTMSVGREGISASQGFQMGRNSDAKAKVTVDGGDLYYHVGFLREGSSLTVKNGGVVHMDRTLKPAAEGNYDNGTVLVDGGTFTPWTTTYSGIMSDWFNDSTGTFSVGAGGATLQTPSFTHLGMQPSSTAAGAAITKTGAGVLTMRPSPVPVTAQAGTLRMSVSPKAWTNGLAGTITVADGAALEVSGDTVLGAMNVGAAAATFDAAGLERYKHWTANRYAKWRPDGVIQANEAVGSDGGSAIVFNSKVPVDRSFEIAFDTFLYTTTWKPADGWTLYFQKTGTTTYGAGNIGYTGVANSFGVTVDTYNDRIRWGENGAIKKDCKTAGVLTSWGNWANRRHCRLAYDATAHRATFRMTTPEGMEASWSYDVDIASLVGANEAYFGFGGGTGGATAAFSFANVRFVETDAVPAHVRVGGVKTLAAGETFTAKTRPNEVQNGFLMGRLNYADGATLNVADALADTDLAVPARLTTDDPSLWLLYNGAYWREDGSLATSRLLDGTKTGGTAVSKVRYPIGGNWESSFTFELGAHDAAPADMLQYSLVGPSGNMDVQIRYYEDVTEISGSVTNKYNTRKTQVKLFTRGVRHPATVKDFSPIDVVQYGPAKVNVSYDDTVKALTVAMTQQDGARSNSVVFDNVDLMSVLSSNRTAQVRFIGYVGGLYSENVVRDFTFRSDLHDARLAQQPIRGFFGFEKLNGSGTLVKTGAGDLGLVDTKNADVALRLAEGGLRLRREPLEDYTIDSAAGWNFSHASGRYIYPNGIQIGEIKQNHYSNAQTRHQLRVDGDWRCSFSLWVNSGNPADAVSFFLHNDPRGNQCTGGGTSSACFNGIQKSVGLGWYFYPGNTSYKNKVTVGRNGAGLNWGYGQSHAPLTLPGQTTDIVLTYNAAAKTVTSVMTQGATSVTNTFDNFDVAGSVGGSYAWLVFGVGCGGAQATPKITNFKFEHLDNVDALADQRYLASVDMTGDAAVRLDTAKGEGTFRLADTVTLAAGKTLTAESCDQPATLAMGTLTLGEGSVVKGDAETTVKPDMLTGSLDVLKVEGTTLAIPAATVESRALKNSDVVLADGAKIAAPAGRPLSVRHVIVDGVQISNGSFPAATTDWVASGTVTLGGGTFLILR